MVDTVRIGTCPNCGAMIAGEKIKEVENPDSRYPGDDYYECPVCKEIASKYDWNFKDFLVDS